MSALADTLSRYYLFLSNIYDLTRWSFLFGREGVLGELSPDFQPQRILEIGCGTGMNMQLLARAYPEAHITGIDISPDMIAVAERKLAPMAARVTLRQMVYERPLSPNHPFDLVLFSYSLTMMNPGWESVIQAAFDDLRDGGQVAVVDFHDSQFGFFKRWMGVNHVRMDSHLQPKLAKLFVPAVSEVKGAYGRLWTYLLFVGKK